MKNKEKNLAINTVSLYVMRIATYVFPLITTPYLTRVLQENNYGIYTWTNAIINYARLFIDFGFVIYGVEAVAGCRENKEEIGRVIAAIIKLKIVLCVLTGCVLLLLCIFIDSFREHSWMIAISYMPAIISVFSIDYVFQGMEKMKMITIRTMITKALFTILVFVFIQNSNQYYMVPFLTAIGDLLAVVFMWSGIKSEDIRLHRSSRGKELFKKSLWFFWSRIFGAIYTYGDMILIGAVMEKSEVAQYSVAYTTIVVAQNFITPLADSLYPYMVKNKNFKLLNKILVIAEPLILIGCIVAYLISPVAFPFLFGEQYTDAGKYFIYMLPIVAISLPEYLFGYPTLSALNLNKQANIAVVVAGSIHIVILAFLYGMNLLCIESIIGTMFLTELTVLVIRFTCVKTAMNRQKEERI